MLLLNEKDIKALARPEELIDVVEQAVALYEKGDFQMPNRIGVPQGENTYLYMPCFTEAVHGTKALTLFPQNTARGLGRIQGLMLLNDPQTGSVTGILDGAALTAYRTGAVGAVGVSHTTPATAKTLALIGAGVQGWHQCLFAAQVRPIEDIYVFDARADSVDGFCRSLAEALGVRVHPCASAAQAVEQGEVVITATASNEPVLPNDPELLRGKHFIGIGSYKPFMREYPEALFHLVREVLVDVDFAKEETGDLATPLAQGWLKESQVRTLGAALTAPVDTSGTTFYKSVGMALFDVLVADHFFRKASALGVGVEVDW